MLFFKRSKPKVETTLEDSVARPLSGHRNDSLRALMHISETTEMAPAPLQVPAPTEVASTGLRRTVLDIPHQPSNATATPEPGTGALTPPPMPSVLEAQSSNPIVSHPEREVSSMSNIKETIQAALNDIDGASAAALVDYNSGMMLGSGGGGVNLELAAAGNTDVVKAKMRTMQSLGISGSIDDILITLDNQYHIIYLVPGQTLFLYLVLQKDRANLALARYKLKALGAELKV